LWSIGVLHEFLVLYHVASDGRWMGSFRKVFWKLLPNVFGRFGDDTIQFNWVSLSRRKGVCGARHLLQHMVLDVGMSQRRQLQPFTMKIITLVQLSGVGACCKNVTFVCSSIHTIGRPAQSASQSVNQSASQSVLYASISHPVTVSQSVSLVCLRQSWHWSVP
jgi:hypothetical protein